MSLCPIHSFATFSGTPAAWQSVQKVCRRKYGWKSSANVLSTIWFGYSEYFIKAGVCKSKCLVYSLFPYLMFGIFYFEPFITSRASNKVLGTHSKSLISLVGEVLILFVCYFCARGSTIIVPLNRYAKLIQYHSQKRCIQGWFFAKKSPTIDFYFSSEYFSWLQIKDVKIVHSWHIVLHKYFVIC